MTTIVPGTTMLSTPKASAPPQTPQSSMLTTPKPSGSFTTVPNLITKPSTTPSECGRCICGKPPTTMPGPAPSETTPKTLGSETPGPKDTTPGAMPTTPSMAETPVSMKTTVSVQSTPSRGLTGFTPYVSTKKPSTGKPGFMPFLLTPTTPTSARRHVNRGLFNSLRKAFV